MIRKLIKLKIIIMKTLKEVSEKIGKPYHLVRKAKKLVEERYNAPAFMVWGTGSKKKYNPDTFREIIERHFE